MLTANLNKNEFLTECGLRGTLTNEEIKNLSLGSNVIRCPLFKGKSCSNEKLQAIKNDQTQEMFRDRFIQLRSPFCVKNEDIEVDWNKYETFLVGLIRKEKKEDLHLGDIKDDK